MLAAFVQEGHDHVDPAGLSSYCRDHPLQVLEVVVRGHAVDISRQGVGQAVVAHIHHNVNVLAADGFSQDSLGFAGTKTGHFGVDQVVVPLIAAECHVVLVGMSFLPAPFYDIIVYLVSHLLDAVQGYNAKGSYRDIVQVAFITT